jgi:O-antigen/teichoic acid export membrane protein
MYRRIARNSAFYAGGTAASSLFMMLAVAIAARGLPAHDFGVLVLLQSSALMLRALTSFSTQQPVIKLGADAQAEGDQQRLGVIISMGLVVDLLASTIAFVVAACLIELSRPVVGLGAEKVGSAWIFSV